MKSFFHSIFAAAALAASAAAATAPIYFNDAPMVPPMVPPQIDATAFVNRNQFTVGSAFDTSFAFGALFFFGSPSLYDFQSTLYYTNTGSGLMSGNPGYRFDFITNEVTPMVTYAISNNTVIEVTNLVTNVVRRTAAVFENRGRVSGFPHLQIYATNVHSSGTLETSSGGLLQLRGGGVDLDYGGLRAGQAEEFFFGGGISLASNYVNQAGITDIYWGRGTNNSMTTAGAPMRLDQNFFPNFNLPFPQSPIHQVTQAGLTGTFSVTIPGFFGFGFLTNFPNASGFGAFVYTNQPTPTNAVVQVVFVNTNSVLGDTNFITEVRFAPDSFGADDGGLTAMVQFQMIDFDIVDRRSVTNYIHFVDQSAFLTNIFLGRNLVTPSTRKPNTYSITRGIPFQWLQASPPNAEWSETNNWIYGPNHASNAVTVSYLAYSAQIGNPTIATGPIFLGQVLSPSLEPTNMAGRVEIEADTLSLDQTRIRAESLVSIKTANLLSNNVAMVDAPFVNYDLTTLQPVIELTNMAPAAVRRLSGRLSAWTGMWTNVVTNIVVTNITEFVTNIVTTRFHVLVLDNALQTLQPVVVDEFAIQGNHVILSDTLRFGKRFRVDADSLHIRQGLDLPFGMSWGATNVLRVRNFTNDGAIFIPQLANFGADRPEPYQNFVNNGAIVASALFVRSQNVDQPGTISATGGNLEIVADTFSLVGTPFNPARLNANSDIRLQANNLVASNSIIQALGLNGVLSLTVTNLLTDGTFRTGDGWVTSTNEWITTGGFSLLRQPASGTLLGSRLHSRSTNQFSIVRHVWSAEDRGPVNEGFHDNHAVGHLILDGQAFSTFRFSGTGANNALYVDYLEFVNYATNYVASLQVDPNFTIYFAHANVGPERLEARTGGRLRWVSSFTGPNSSTNITYPSGNTFTFNTSLAQSNDIDSDGDGIVNSQDPTPFIVPGENPVIVQIAAQNLNTLSISWLAPSHSINALEAKMEDSSKWQTVTNFTQGRRSEEVTVTEQIGSGNNKLYRVRVTPVSP
jgi:hypothetical protein